MQIAYAATQGRRAAFLTKRPKTGACYSYKCHMFVLAKEKEVCRLLWYLPLCNPALSPRMPSLVYRVLWEEEEC